MIGMHCDTFCIVLEEKETQAFFFLWLKMTNRYSIMENKSRFALRVSILLFSQENIHRKDWTVQTEKSRFWEEEYLPVDVRYVSSWIEPDSCSDESMIIGWAIGGEDDCSIFPLGLRRVMRISFPLLFDFFLANRQETRTIKMRINPIRRRIQPARKRDLIRRRSSKSKRFLFVLLVYDRTIMLFDQFTGIDFTLFTIIMIVTSNQRKRRSF